MLQTKSNNIQGTLTLPPNSTSTVVIIVSGPLQIDRDGNQPLLFRTDCYKLYASTLANNNIASLRYDKRGVSASSSPNLNPTKILIPDHVSDLKGWIKLLKQRFQKILLAGHGEGSLISLVAASEGADVNGLILIAGNGRTADVVMKDNLANQNPILRDMAYEIIDSLSNGVTVKNVPVYLRSLFDISMQPYLISSMKYDPQKLITQIKLPILIIHGDTDTQVSISDALALHSGNKKASLKIISEMNHFMKWCPSTDRIDQMDSYTNPAYPLSSDFIIESIKFIKTI